MATIYMGGSFLAKTPQTVIQQMIGETLQYFKENKISAWSRTGLISKVINYCSQNYEKAFLNNNLQMLIFSSGDSNIFIHLVTPDFKIIYNHLIIKTTKDYTLKSIKYEKCYIGMMPQTNISTQQFGNIFKKLDKVDLKESQKNNILKYINLQKQYNWEGSFYELKELYETMKSIL